MKQQVLRLAGIPVMLLLLGFLFLTPAYAMMTPYLDITETWDGNAVIEFTVDTSYDDIIGFAVGNNNYLYLWASTDTPGWEASVAVDNPSLGKWVIPEYGPGDPPEVTYSDIPDGFNLDFLASNGYGKSFLFFNDGGAALSAGITGGFLGLAYDPDSSFVAFRSNGEIITGDTSVVPIPGAAVLLLSGLVGLVGIRRKR